MSPELFLNLHYLWLLCTIRDLVAEGKPVPQEIIDHAVDVGRKAKVPKEEINILQTVNDPDSAIH